MFNYTTPHIIFYLFYVTSMFIPGGTLRILVTENRALFFNLLHKLR